MNLDETKKILSMIPEVTLNLENDKIILEFVKFLNELKLDVCAYSNKKKSRRKEIIRDFCRPKFQEVGYEIKKGNGISIWSKKYWNVMGFDNEQSENIIKKLQRENSKGSKEHWIKRGITDPIEIEKLISEYQSGVNKKYIEKIMLNNNISLEDAKIVFSNIKKTQSKRSVEYWLKEGYTLKEAKEKIRITNPMVPEFWEERGYKTDDAILKAKITNKKAITNRQPTITSFDYQQRIMKSKTKTFSDVNNMTWVSKMENAFFKEFIEYTENNQNTKYTINHIPFGVTYKKIDGSSAHRIADGYVRIDNNVVLIEFDGTYWYNKNNDQIKDELTLLQRNDILGVVRIDDLTYMNSKRNIENLFEEIINAIQKIENREEKFIRM